MDGPNRTTKQLVILAVAATLDLFWMCLPTYLVLFVGSAVGSEDGALGKQWGILLLFALCVVTMLAWIPTAEKVSRPLIKKLARRIGATRDKE